MRIRTIKPDFWLHEGLAELSPLHRLLFIGLWMLADRDGRLEDRPNRIAAAIFPYAPDADVHALLADLDAAGHVQRYGDGLLSIPGFSEHQRPHPKEPKSVFPAPPDRGAKRRAPPPETLVYFLQDERTKLVKIGASRDVPSRVAMLGTGNPGGFTLLGSRRGGFALERVLHLQLAEDREVGEWFRPTPAVLNAVIDHGRVEPGLASVPSTPVGREGKGREGKEISENGGRRRALSDALCARFLDIRGEKYRFNADADGSALSQLLKLSGDDAVILDKWDRGLRLGATFPGLSTIAELAGKKWNHLSAPAGPPKSTQGPCDPSTMHHTEGRIHDF